MKAKSILLVAAVAMSLAACNKTKKADSASECCAKDTTTACCAKKDTAACCAKKDSIACAKAEAPAVVPAVALKEFKALAKSYGEAFNNISKNPKKFQELAVQVQTKAAEIASISDQLKPAQLKEYEKALKLIAEVNAGGTKKKK
ncbi:hypothetical protein SAMD00024442_21_56 [Candidatus Symbiothrix dinenymphae]|nr:hypothetical protein SAMD00024442_21_56 [Candidatus Symbiothrix dinenymphae]